MRVHRLLILLLSISLLGHASEKFYNDFDSNPHLTPAMRQRIKPHILPKDHAMKPALDAIFGTQRATLNQRSMREAGFTILFAKQRSFILVVRHPTLPGYLIKANVDAQKKLKHNIPAWKWLVQRCIGVQKVRRAIKQHQIEHFQAPKKWLYPLPVQPAPQKGMLRQPVVLLVEDMQLVSWEDNLHAWKHQVTHKHLDELYLILSQAGGSSYRPDNIWMSKNGKFSFIDTEYPYQTRPDYRRIRPYLSTQNRAYWDHLVRTGGSPK